MAFSGLWKNMDMTLWHLSWHIIILTTWVDRRLRLMTLYQSKSMDSPHYSNDFLTSRPMFIQKISITFDKPTQLSRQIVWRLLWRQLQKPWISAAKLIFASYQHQAIRQDHKLFLSMIVDWLQAILYYVDFVVVPILKVVIVVLWSKHYDTLWGNWMIEWWFTQGIIMVPIGLPLVLNATRVV